MPTLSMGNDAATSIPGALLRWLAGRGTPVIRLPRILKRRAALFGLMLVVPTLTAALFAERLAPRSPTAIDLSASLQPPGWMSSAGSVYVLGTDNLGRDVLSRIVFGARASLLVAGVSVVAAAFVGIPLGMLSGYRQGRIDDLLVNLMNIQLALPFILLVLVIVGVLGAGMWKLIIAMILSSWVIWTRLVRAITLRVKTNEFIEAANALGSTDSRILVKHIFPNAVPELIVLASLECARLILVESAASFLGLGIQPPTVAWGLMLSEGKKYIFQAWWLSVFSGLAITTTVLGINLLGDVVRDELDPFLRV